MADKCRAYTRKALSWYAERDDQFNVTAAFVRVRPRANQKERARTRVLSDEEIRIIWPVLGHTGTFGAMVKMLLLTGQRRDEVAHMSRNEIGKDGIWVIPAERYKTKRPNHVPLSKAALALIKSQPKFSDCDLIFPSRAKTPYSGFTKSKAKLDKAVLAAMKAHAKAGTDGRASAKLDPSRSTPHREDVDGSRWRATRYFGARAWARHSGRRGDL